MKNKPLPPIWTAEDRERHRATREAFQDRPSRESLVESGELTGRSMPHGLYLELRDLQSYLRIAREAAGLTLPDLARKLRVEVADISRLETSRFDVPPLDLLWKYAHAVGKRLSLTTHDLSPKAPPTAGTANGSVEVKKAKARKR